MSSDKAPMLDSKSVSSMGETKSSKDKKAKAKAKTKAMVSSEALIETYEQEDAQGAVDETMVDVRSLHVPDSIKNLLMELDMEGDGDGQLSEQKLKDALSLMKALKNGLDVDGSGAVSKLELEGGIELITRLARDRHANTGVLEYGHMPDCIKGVMKDWDLDDSGHVCITELAAAASAFKKVQQEGRIMRKIIIGLTIILLLLMTGVFVLSLAAVEITKESHVESGQLIAVDGTIVATRSSDFEICKDGTMAQAGKCAAAGAGRRLLEENNGDAVKTVNIKQTQSLSSSLSDTFFMALDEIAVYSDKGHSLRLQIHGFARVPVLNSRCGNIVHLYTAWNGRVTLDSVDLSFDEATEAAFANAGFSLVTGGVSGRRLAGDHTVDGFFSAVQGVAAEGWTCQDVPLPTLPSTYTQHFSVYRSCAVKGVTGTKMDMCDSLYGGVVPGTDVLSGELQLATMTKTDRIKAKLSVDVPLGDTLFAKSVVETMKSPGYTLQITKFDNHPGMLRVSVFDRKTGDDIYFQLIDGRVEAERLYCNSTDADATSPQKKELEAEKQGVDRSMHFEFMDMIEEKGRMLRHFRMMLAEDFIKWMGGKNASSRPTDSYYEYWDDAETLAPVRLVNPDGSVVDFASAKGDTTDDDVVARLKALGSDNWASLFACSATELITDEAVKLPELGAVPVMMSPMMDLTQEDLSFYAKLHLDTHVENSDGVGFITLGRRAEEEGPLSAFAKYAMRAQSPLAMADLCRDMCAKQMDALEAELSADTDLEICDAVALSPAVSCLLDKASVANSLCSKNNLINTIHNDCYHLANASNNRRLSDEAEGYYGEDDGSDEEDGRVGVEASELYLARMGRRGGRPARKLDAEGPANLPSVTSAMRQLSDGTMEVDLDSLEQEHREQLGKAIGAPDLRGGKIYFNASDKSEQSRGFTAFLQAKEDEYTTHSRRLFMDFNCVAPGVAPGCWFSVGFPWGCDPIDNNPRCSFGLAMKTQIGGPYHGALTIKGNGCIEEWAFSVPPPFDGSVCVDGGIEMDPNNPACGLPFTLRGWVGLTATVGLDLWIVSFVAESLRIEVGASIENYKYNCDDRRRRRRWAFGRRRGADKTCDTACDVRVYVKTTWTKWFGRLWGLMQYWCKHQDFDLIIGVDIYIWAVFTSWWETVAQVQIV